MDKNSFTVRFPLPLPNPNPNPNPNPLPSPTLLPNHLPNPLPLPLPLPLPRPHESHVAWTSGHIVTNQAVHGQEQFHGALPAQTPSINSPLRSEMGPTSQFAIKLNLLELSGGQVQPPPIFLVFGRKIRVYFHTSLQQMLFPFPTAPTWSITCSNCLMARCSSLVSRDSRHRSRNPES